MNLPIAHINMQFKYVTAVIPAVDLDDYHI